MSDKDDGRMDKDLKDIDDENVKGVGKYYKPEHYKVPDVDIPKEDLEDSPLNRLGNGDTLNVQLDSDVIIQKLSHEIYSGWQSGLRELYNNEARACRITSKQHLTSNPTIHITIDPIERQLVIEGIDSQGITVEVFDKSLRVLGVSSNFDSKEIGQMGMGFAGYTMIFEALKLDTYARETNEKWSVLADGGINFKVLGTPSMESYGTRLSGTYKENINVDEMFEHIQVLSRFSLVKTIIHLTEDTHEHNSGSFVCDSYKGGYHYLMKMRAEHLVSEDSYRAKSQARRKELMIPISIEREDFDFYGYLALFRTTYDSTRKESISSDMCITTLIGTPIDSTLGYEFNMLSGYVLNIKDERKYKPTTDRDRLKDDSLKLVEAEIHDEIINIFKQFELTSVEDYIALNDRQKMLYDSNVWHDTRYFIDDTRTRNLVGMMNKSYTTYPSKHLMTVKEMLKDYDNVIALKGLRKEPIEKLSNVLDKPVFFRLGTTNNRYGIDIEDELVMLREFGVIFGEQYIREHKVKSVRPRVKGQEFTDCSVRMYSNWNAKGWGKSRYGNKHTSYLISEINENRHDGMMRVSKDRWSFIEGYDCGFMWLRDRKGYDGIKTLDERFKELENIMFEVNSDKMLFKDIPKGNRIFYCDVNPKIDGDNPFNLNELRIEDKKDSYIYPAEYDKLNSFFKNIDHMRDIIDVYCMVKDRNYGEEETLLTKLKHKMKVRLDLPTDRYTTVELNKMIKLNRFKDLIPDNEPLYQLTKQAMLQSDEDQSLRILELGLKLGGVDV